VEEDTRGGYVRYVTTRYGNLVDAFSLTSKHLAQTVISEYDVSPSKCHVIYTGVDSATEFSPEHVTPVDGLDPGLVHILYIGRLIRQKDPHLMVQVADRLKRRVDGFQIHVVGYGPMEQETRDAVWQRGLDDVVVFHEPTDAPAPWYAACDLVLLTSVFEGIPYVLFEALSMQVPMVAPELPGTAEIMDESCGRLIAPRDDVDAYVHALAELVRNPGIRARLGEAGRRRMTEEYTLERMAREHEQLYERLLGRRTGGARPGMVV
jgi:glycosyltransferase involved in cell wall biosynthesis